MTGNVKTIILKYNIKLKSFIIVISKITFSDIDLFGPLKLTCESPVKPGLTDCLFFYVFLKFLILG